MLRRRPRTPRVRAAGAFRRGHPRHGSRPIAVPGAWDPWDAARRRSGGRGRRPAPRIPRGTRPRDRTIPHCALSFRRIPRENNDISAKPDNRRAAQYIRKAGFGNPGRPGGGPVLSRAASAALAFLQAFAVLVVADLDLAVIAAGVLHAFVQIGRESCREEGEISEVLV